MSVTNITNVTNINKISRWQLFFKNIQQDLKLYVFILLILCIFRIGFIAILHQYLNEATTLKEIMTALYWGMRISLKSAGIITIVSFLCCTLLTVIFANNYFGKIRKYIGYVSITMLAMLFNARIPFYQEFHMAFNQFIFNTLKDDVTALGYTLVQQYNLPSRLFFSLVLAVLFCRGLKALLAAKIYPLPRFSRWYATVSFRTGIVLGIGILMLFSRFGGSFNYAKSINWENGAVSRDEFLNEAILDDVQALYRAYVTYTRVSDGTWLHVEGDHVAKYAAHLAGKNLNSNNLNDFLKKQAQGPKIDKPKHIFIIVGESYAGWPLMPKYKDLNIANGLKSMIAQGNAAYTAAFLPNGTGTMEAMNGLITGLAEVSLSPNYQPGAYKEIYSTAIAPQMKKLGYKTYLWYGGFSSWQRMKEFSLGQGFDEFYSSSDIDHQSGNAWGSEDKKFLNGLSSVFKAEEPSFHLILTTSNHPPYTIDVQQEGFDPQNTFAGLTNTLKSDKEVMTKLGHFWYSDKVITEFVQTMYKQYPESIFVITGDHANRFNLEPNPSAAERYTIPYVLYGQGIYPQLLPPNAAGGQLNIMPTLMELIAPQGFEYYSVVESMTKNSRVGINRELWVTSDEIGKTNFKTVERVPWSTKNTPETAAGQIKEDVDAVQAVSWWMIKNGKNMEMK